ncbi:MAG TPA: hypothetical protein VGP67_10650, partial [Gaiellales bacterium]|nr:hypothetical protein [Gaiellales bacterium]
ADAVRPDQTYPVAVSEDEGDIVEERFGVVRRPQSVCFQHGPSYLSGASIAGAGGRVAVRPAS